MIKATLLNTVLLLLLFNVSSFAKSDSTVVYDNTINSIERYIVSEQLDSALLLISQQNSTPYLKSLERIIRNEKVSYKEYKTYFDRIAKQAGLPYIEVSNYINENIAEPSDHKSIDLDYVDIKWNQISKLRDEVGIEEASSEQAKLDDYINKFDSNDISVRKAQIISSTHQIVLHVIQREVDKGKKLCLENFEEAKMLNDKKLMIISLYYLCDFLIFEGKLDKYISTCEEGLAIENMLQNKSSYYAGTLIHIIDAYIYKGDNEDRVNTLLAELYKNHDSRAQSFSLYAKYLGGLDLNSLTAKSIFNQFEVSGLVTFCEETTKLGEKALNPNDLYQLNREISNTLEIHGYLKEAIDFKDQTVVSIKKIYSQDLANSLANFKTSQAVKEKDLQIKHQNERNQLYLIIASLIAVLLFISILAFWRKQKQSKVLATKNKQINKALKEKELLVREVHHRVKNNFQIVSSLLELQTRGIEDEKALMLASEGQNRVKSMALIHQKLYQNEDGLIDFDEYINLLVRELTSMFGSEIAVQTKVSAENMRFDVDTAIPLGLIVNELITNAYKYAFNDAKTGELDIVIAKEDDGNYKLTVADNGPGMENEFNIKRAKSLGLRLVSRLVKQLQGTLALNNDNGASFEITFKDIDARRTID